MDDAQRQSTAKTVVYSQDIPARPAPTREVGAVAWIRDNLFKTWLDVFLTVAGIVISVGVVVSFILWAVGTANWWSISFNFRQFMLGRYEAIYEWRVVLATIVTVFCCGMAVAVWIKQISRLAFITVITLLVVLFLFPTLIIALVPMPTTLIGISAERIIVGSATEIPPRQVAFLGKAGETITIRRVSAPLQDDASLSAIAGFMDSTTNLMRTAAANRLVAIARQAELQAALERDAQSPIPVFTANQRRQRQAELERLQVPDPIVSTYNIGKPPVQVQVLDRALNPTLGDAVLLASVEDVARYQLPSDGWYVLQMAVDIDDVGIAVLELEGIYPIIRSTALAGAEEGSATTGFASTYIRMTDTFQINDRLPTLNGTDLPFYNIVNNQYRGTRSLETYLRIYLAPFLQKLSVDVGILLLAGVAGYWLVVVMQRVRSVKFANRTTAYAMISLPLFIWVMAAGLTIPEILSLTTVVAALVYVLFMFYVGASWGKNRLTVAMLALSAPLMMALPQLLFENSYGLGLFPLINLFIIVPALMAWNAGGAMFGIPDNAPQVRRNLLLFGGVLLVLIIVPKALLMSGALSLTDRYPEWILAASDQRRWGGLLLTMILTIFGIIVAFPIGVGLAIGRRSKLPAIKYGCTLYIELVRGSPFITVLFMMQLMIPLINPAFTQIPGTIRALVAVIMFSAAYLAENVRGGLQSLPPGQTEAARALGLSPWQVTLLITLPQALRAVIPALVGQFIALFKDTSLVAIVGLTDLTGFVNIMTVQAEFIGTRAEGLVFITLIYFVFSYVMAYISRLLEASGSGKTRRMV